MEYNDLLNEYLTEYYTFRYMTHNLSDYYQLELPGLTTTSGSATTATNACSTTTTHGGGYITVKYPTTATIGNTTFVNNTVTLPTSTGLSQLQNYSNIDHILWNDMSICVSNEIAERIDSKVIEDILKLAIEEDPSGGVDIDILMMRYKAFLRQERIQSERSYRYMRGADGRRYVGVPETSTGPLVTVLLSAGQLELVQKEWSRQLRAKCLEAEKKDKLQVMVDNSIPGYYDE